ncbi:MAG: HipA family kinase [Bacteroidia bacterium]
MSVNPVPLRRVHLTRYITPLREGGSMPAIAEADDGFHYVVKFRGAGQGTKALIAELIGGELARLMGLKVPELVFVDLDEAFGRTEPDEEIQDLLKASTGLNIALHYLSGAITFDPVVSKPDALTASKIVWLDALLMNMDRTARNANMLMWKNELWLIDHGASLYFHHTGTPWDDKALQAFPLISNHVLIKEATEIESVSAQFKLLLNEEKINSIVQQIPGTWMEADFIYPSLEEQRKAYANYLNKRIQQADIFVKEVLHAK